MNTLGKLSRPAAVILAGALAGLAGSTLGSGTNSYVQTNLVSDLAGGARFTDTNLVNSWGLLVGSDGVVTVVDNGAGLATFYNTTGRPLPLSITVPAPAGSTEHSAPTDLALNPFEGSFVLAHLPTNSVAGNEGDDDGRGDGEGGDHHGGGDGGGDGHRGNNGGDGHGDGQGGQAEGSVLLFATEDGTIAGWGPQLGTNRAMLLVDHSASGAIYKGLALASTWSGPRLFVTDFHSGLVEMYDGQFKLLKTFTDPNLPANFAPFGIRNIGGQLFVTFAQQDQALHDDVAGPGLGYVDVFDTDGMLVRRFASQGTLSAPWGLAMAPRRFGAFGGALLVGNFGDGTINAFNPWTGMFLGQLQDPRGNTVQIDGLWGLAVGPEHEEASALYFTAGPNDESDGLLGILSPVQAMKNGKHRRATAEPAISRARSEAE